MAFLNPAVVEGIRVVVRQATGTVATVTSSIVNDLTTSPTVSPTTSPVSASSTSGSAAPSETYVGGGNGPPTGPPAGGGNNNNNNNNNNGGNSSPLLFFVALGFGVVFTNLWIIVGVKYCFRYNARSRQMRMAEDGEPINMENMPRPHRRRREKKLMTMDEVNEKFPMMKYKSWVATRVQEGLPTRGGVSAPPSRAGSVRDVDGASPDLLSKERMSADERPTTSAAATPEKAKHAAKESTSSVVNAAPRTSTDARLVPIVSESATLAKEPNRASHDDDDDDDEHINAALPPECMGTAGDTCAICIDTLEDDDDVRGLTCGHAFHAVCLDPWLTSRRACCPLCKTDYYTPKPRPAAAEAGDGTTGVAAVPSPGDRGARMNLPGRPRHAFFGLGRSGLPVPYGSSNQATRRSTSQAGRSGPGRLRLFSVFNQERPAPSPSTPALSPTGSHQTRPQPRAMGHFAVFRSAFPAFRLGIVQAQNNATAASGANPAVTPSNLEAGTRNPAT